MMALVQVSEHENWIRRDKLICRSDPSTVDLRKGGGGGEKSPSALFA